MPDLSCPRNPHPRQVLPLAPGRNNPFPTHIRHIRHFFSLLPPTWRDAPGNTSDGLTQILGTRFQIDF
jgi:hypothetical protein